MPERPDPSLSFVKRKWDKQPEAEASEPDPNCTTIMRRQNKPYPRTCAVCRLGPCRWFDNNGNRLSLNPIVTVEPEASEPSEADRPEHEESTLTELSSQKFFRELIDRLKAAEQERDALRVLLVKVTLQKADLVEQVAKLQANQREPGELGFVMDGEPRIPKRGEIIAFDIGAPMVVTWEETYQFQVYRRLEQKGD